MVGLREAILSASDYLHEDIQTEQWGTVRVREMSGPDRYALADLEAADPPLGAWLLMVKALRMSLFDPETGEQLFTEDDEPALAQKSPHVISFLFSVVQRVSGLGAAELEQAMGKSEPSPSETPGTD